jgi:hypothetical protein
MPSIADGTLDLFAAKLSARVRLKWSVGTDLVCWHVLLTVCRPQRICEPLVMIKFESSVECCASGSLL